MFQNCRFVYVALFTSGMGSHPRQAQQLYLPMPPWQRQPEAHLAQPAGQQGQQLCWQGAHLPLCLCRSPDGAGAVGVHFDPRRGMRSKAGNTETMVWPEMWSISPYFYLFIILKRILGRESVSKKWSKGRGRGRSRFH